MKTAIALSAAFVAAFTVGAAAADTKVKFEYWYGLNGYLGKIVQQTCDRFNASQDKYEIVCIGQDGYDNAIQNTIAAFRAGKHPTIVQAVDSATADLLMSGQFYPVYKMMDDFNIKIDWSDYFPAIANYYATSKGKMVAMPFNSSTAVMYYNTDDFAKAGAKVPDTWEEFETALHKLKAANPDKCAFAYEPYAWVDMDQFSMAHGVPIATENNGYDGLDAEFVYNKTSHVKHMEDLLRWYKEDLSEIKTTKGGMNTQQAFAQNVCSIYFGSIASHATVNATAVEGLHWDVAMIPVFAGTERKNTVVGGAALWVLAGKSEDEYRGAAEYLKFLATPDSARFWSTNTGYIPVTKTGYDALVAEGFYDKAPFKGREVAIKSLTYSEVTPLTRGVRLGFYVQARKEWTSEMQAVFAGEKTVQQGLDEAVARSNKMLRNFERTYKGKTFP